MRGRGRPVGAGVGGGAGWGGGGGGGGGGVTKVALCVLCGKTDQLCRNMCFFSNGKRCVIIRFTHAGVAKW